MGIPRHQVVMLGLLSFAALGCIADITGAPCDDSSTCPNGQYCSSGRCVTGTGPSGAGGGGSTGGGGGGATLTCKVCTGATDTTSCGSGTTCKQRLCDGKWACHPSSVGIDACLTVGGVKCPTAPNFTLCTSTSQCAAGSDCMYGRSFQACPTPSSQVDPNCILPDFTNKKLLPGLCLNDPSNNDKRCYPKCASALDPVCTKGTACYAFDSGNFGYCDNYSACVVCSDTGGCPTDSTCRTRHCDGLRGCAPKYNPGYQYCDTINGVSTPNDCNLEVCVTKDDCGAQSECLGFSPNTTVFRCLQSCTTAADCAALSWGTSTATCVSTGATYGLRCFAECTATSDCPTIPAGLGMTCVENGIQMCY